MKQKCWVRHDKHRAEGLGMFGGLVGFFLLVGSVFVFVNESLGFFILPIWFIYIALMRWCWQTIGYEYYECNGKYIIAEMKPKGKRLVRLKE